MTNKPEDHATFLSQLGNLVRGQRAKRGMSRKVLANDSSVSQRFLANLEQGKGNISINRLRQVAFALHVKVSDLLPSNIVQTPEHTLLNDFVAQLSQVEQETALEMLYQKFARLQNGQVRVALIGLRGAGKTTLGQLLEERQQLPFIRIVKKIELLAGMQVAEILALSGQPGYRRLEAMALSNTLAKHKACCIETGGSVVSEPREFNQLLSSCLVIWVSASPQEHMSRVVAQGDKRPMADNKDAMADLRQILSERTPYYQKAHAELDTSSKTVEESYTELVSLIREHHLSHI